MNKQELVQAVKNREFYNYIANNYSNMTRDELKDICLELDYSIHRALRFEDELIDLFPQILEENLRDRFDIEEEVEEEEQEEEEEE